MFGDCVVLSAVRGSLFVVCCLVLRDCCLFVVCYLMIVVGRCVFWLLVVGRWSLSRFVACVVLFVVCCSLCVVCCMLCVVCCLCVV